MFEQFIRNKEWSSSVPRQFWKREFLIENSLYFFSGILHEDELFSFKALLSCQRTSCINESLAMRRFRDGSITMVSISPEHIRGLLICLNEMTQFWMSNQYSKSTDEMIYKHLRDIRFSIKRKAESMEEFQINGLQNQFLKELFLEPALPEYCIELDKLLVEKLKKKRIIIFGAGQIAKEVMNKLSAHDIVIDRIFVSDINKSRKSIYGHRVYELVNNDKNEKDTIVLLSVSQKYNNLIIPSLMDHGYDNIIVMAAR